MMPVFVDVYNHDIKNLVWDVWLIRYIPLKPHLAIFRLLERSSRHLRLLNLLGLRPSPFVLPSPLSHPVETMTSPS